MIEGGRPRYMIPSAENTERDAKRSNPQDRVKRGKTQMTVKLDVYRPFAHMRKIIVKAIEAERGTGDRHWTKIPGGAETAVPGGLPPRSEDYPWWIGGKAGRSGAEFQWRRPELPERRGGWASSRIQRFP